MSAPPSPPLPLPKDDDATIERQTFPGIRQFIKSVKNANGVSGKLRIDWIHDGTRASVIHSNPPVLILPTVDAIEGIMKLSREESIGKLKAGIIEEICHLKTSRNHSPELFACVRSNVDSHLSAAEKGSEYLTGKMHRLAEAVQKDTGQRVGGKNLTVSIPDDLHKRLRALDPPGNVSGAVREHITGYIKTREFEDYVHNMRAKHDTRTIEELATAFGISYEAGNGEHEEGSGWATKVKEFPYRIYTKAGDLIRGHKDRKIAEEQAKQIFQIGKRECELRGPDDDVICRYYFETSREAGEGAPPAGATPKKKTLISDADAGKVMKALQKMDREDADRISGWDSPKDDPEAYWYVIFNDEDLVRMREDLKYNGVFETSMEAGEGEERKKDTKPVNGWANRDTWKVAMWLNAIDKETSVQAEKVAKEGKDALMGYVEGLASSGAIADEADLTQVDWDDLTDQFANPYGKGATPKGRAAAAFQRQNEVQGALDDEFKRALSKGAPEMRAKCNWCQKVLSTKDAIENAQGEYFCSQACKNADDRDTEAARKEALDNPPKNESGPVDYRVQEATGAMIHDKVRNAANNCYEALSSQLHLFVDQMKTYPKEGYPVQAAGELGENILFGYLVLALENENWEQHAKDGTTEQAKSQIIQGAAEHAREMALDKFGMLRPTNNKMQELVGVLSGREELIRTMSPAGRRSLAEQLHLMMFKLIGEYMKCYERAMKDSGA